MTTQNPNPAPRARITMAGQVVYQSTGQGVLPAVLRWSRELPGPGDPCVRPNQPVGPEWVPVDTGWAKNVDFIILENRGPSDSFLGGRTRRGLVLTVEVGVLVSHPSELPEDVCPVLRIPAGETHPLSPLDCSRLRLRCLGGLIRVTVTSIPLGTPPPEADGKTLSAREGAAHRRSTPSRTPPLPPRSDS